MLYEIFSLKEHFMCLKDWLSVSPTPLQEDYLGKVYFIITEFIFLSISVMEIVCAFYAVDYYMYQL